MKKILCLILIILLSGCSNSNTSKLNIKIQNIIDTGNYQIVDVRTKEEYESSHLVGAINIPYDTIDENVTLNKDVPVLVYCASGRRSNIAYNTLSILGYEVYDLGGYDNIDLPKE